MRTGGWLRLLGCVAALVALTACSSSSSTGATSALCYRGIRDTIDLHLDALDKTLPLHVRACVQKRPCQTADTKGSQTLGQGGMSFRFTLDDKHQEISVPVAVDITSGGKTIAHGTVKVQVLQDFVRGPHSSANCGGRGAIDVTKTGQLQAEPITIGGR